MALNKLDSLNQSRDTIVQRLGTGTITGAHVQTGTLDSKAMTGVIDDTNTRILYGNSIPGNSSQITQVQGNSTAVSNTETIMGGISGLGVPGSAAQLNFIGTSIGVLGGINKYSGLIQVYIDGVLTPGRTPAFLPFNVSANSVNTPVLSKTAVAVTGWGSNPRFAAAGTLLIGNELMTYTSIVPDVNFNDVYTGVTRGAFGTIAVEHFASESIYSWASSYDCSPIYEQTNYSTKQLLYYNPFLSPGDHTITVVVVAGITGYSRLYFDGFITGSLLGSRNILTQTATVTAAVMIDANGHGVLGQLAWNSADVTVIGMLGYYQVGTETSNATVMGKLGVARDATYTNGPTWPFYYIHNAPPGGQTFVFTFSYLGEAL